MIVVWGPERDADTAVREIYLRAREALVGVPAETRQALALGLSAACNAPIAEPRFGVFRM